MPNGLCILRSGYIRRGVTFVSCKERLIHLHPEIYRAELAATEVIFRTCLESTSSQNKRVTIQRRGFVLLQPLIGAPRQKIVIAFGISDGMVPISKVCNEHSRIIEPILIARSVFMRLLSVIVE